MDKQQENTDGDEYEDDEAFGVVRKDFFESIKMEKWASLFDPFLLPDRNNICLAWLHDATVKNFQQLGICDLQDIETIRSAIHERLVEMNFDFDEDDTIRPSSLKKFSTKVDTSAENSTKTVSSGDIHNISILNESRVDVPFSSDKIDIGLFDHELLSRQKSRSSKLVPLQSKSADENSAKDIISVEIDLNPDTIPSRRMSASLNSISKRNTEVVAPVAISTENISFAPLRRISEELSRAVSPTQRKASIKIDDKKKKEFGDQMWSAISKTRGTVCANKLVPSPNARPSSPSDCALRPSSVGVGNHRPSSPGCRPRTPTGKVVKSSPKSDDESPTPMLYGEMVAAFNLLQRQIAELKSSYLREFKNEIGCEIVNLLLMGPRMSHMYLCIGGKWFTVPTERSIAGYCAITGEALNIPEVHADSRFNIDADIATGFVTKSMLCRPILSRRDKSVVGVIELINKIKRDEGRSFVIGSDVFSPEDDVACDLFVQKLSKEIDDNFRSLYVKDELMDAFVKPISDICARDDKPQYLKTTTAAEMSNIIHQIDEPHVSPDGRDFYAEHKSTRLRLGNIDAKMSAEIERDKEVGAYLRSRHKHERPSSAGSPRKISPTSYQRSSSPKTALRRPQTPSKSILYPPLFPDVIPDKDKSPVFKI